MKPDLMQRLSSRSGRAHWLDTCPPLLMHTIAFITTISIFGGLWERLDAQDAFTDQPLPYPGAEWAAQAAQQWPFGAPGPAKLSYFACHFPALFLHGMVYNWWVSYGSSKLSTLTLLQ
jgi:hypothetical protein